MTSPVSRIASVVFSTSMFFTSPAQAISITLRMDDATRRSIEAMPDLFATAIVKAIQEGMPRLDESVLLYMKEAERIMKETVGAINCTVIQAGGRTLEDAIEDGIRKGTWRKAVQRLSPIAETNRLETEALESITTAKTAGEIADMFGDLAFVVGIQVCRTDGVAQTTRDVLAARMKFIETDHMMWQYIRTVCSTVDDCVAKRSTIVRGIISRSDPRDVLKVEATDRLAKIEFPKPLEKTFWGGNKNHAISIDLYSGPLLELQNIEFSIVATLNAREKVAADATIAADESIKAMEASAARATGGHSNHDPKQNNNVIAEVASGRNLSPEARKQINLISANAAKGPDAAIDFEARFKSANEAFDAAEKRAKELNDIISARAADAAEQRRERRTPR